MKNRNLNSRRAFLKSSGILFGSTLPLLFMQPIVTFFQNYASNTIDYKTRQTAKLFHENKKFVRRLAKSYNGQGLSHLQLVILGNQGLMKAAVHYDNTRGYPFISYAVWWIRQAMLQGMSENKYLIKVF